MRLTLTAFHLTSYESHKVGLKFLGNSVILICSIFLLGEKKRYLCNGKSKNYLFEDSY